MKCGIDLVGLWVHGVSKGICRSILFSRSGAFIYWFIDIRWFLIGKEWMIGLWMCCMTSHLFLAWVVMIYVQFSVSDVFIPIAMGSTIN